MRNGVEQMVGPARRWRSLGRMRIAVLASMAATLLLLLNPFPASAATTVPIGTQLTAVLQRLGGVSGLGPLAQPLPFTSSTPAQLLGVDQLLDDIGAALASPDVDAQDLEDLEGTYGGVTVDVQGYGGADMPTVATSAGDANVTDIIFKIIATDTIDVPVSYADDLVDLDGGGSGVVPLTFTLSTSTLHLQHDASITDPALVDQSLWLRTLPAAPVPVAERTAPALTLSVDAVDADVVDFTESIGIADVTVNGSFTIHAAIGATLADPDSPSDGKITVDELLNSAIDEMATVAFAPSSGSPDLNLSLSATVTGLTGGTPPAATITATDTDLTTAPGVVVTPTLGDVSDFLNMSPSDLIGSVDRLATWLGNVAAAGNLDPEIPFLGGTFSDVLDVKDKLADLSASLRWASDQPGTQLDDTGLPKFTTLDGFVDLLGTAGFTITPTLGTGHRLSFDLSVADSFTKGIPLGFGNLDVLQGIQVTSNGSANVDAAYEAGLGVVLDLTPLPKESAESGPLSCVDGVDNDGNADIDAADPQCAGLPTLDQRVLLDVGTAAGSPELTATTELTASNINATATVGLLGVGITNGSVVLDDGSGDPAGITVDVYEDGAGADGFLTIEELVNALGGTGNGKVNAAIDAHLAASLPVSASIGSVNLGSGAITATADFAGALADPGVLLDPSHFTVDSSALQTTALYDFSPCDNTKDDDGDGVVNDGCPAGGSPAAVSDPESQSTAMFQAVIDMIRALADQVDALGSESFAGVSLDDDLPVIGRSVSELADLATPLLDLADRLATPSESSIENGCTGSADDDHDGVVNDGCPTKPDGGGSPAPAPEVGADCQEAPGSAVDDDGDGVVNDGCLPVTPSLQTLSAYLQGLLNDELTKAIDAIKLTGPGIPDPTLGVVVTLGYDQPTRSIDLTAEIDSTVRAMTSFNLGLGGSLAGYDIVGLDSTGDLAVDVVTDVTLGFGVDLDDFRPYLLGSTDASITAQAAGENLELAASLGPITVQLGNNDPTPEAGTACDQANAADDDGDGFVNDGCGGQLNPEPVADCSDGLDQDGDGVADDGCAGAPPAASGDSEADVSGYCGNGLDDDGDGIADDGCASAPPVAGDAEADKEAGDECKRLDAVDDDGDTYVNDGCPPQGNPGLAYLGAGFSIAESGGDTDRHFFAPTGSEDSIAFVSGNGSDPAFAGEHPTECTDDLAPGGSTAVACARLPIYADLGGGLTFLSPLTMVWQDFSSAPTITVDETALLNAIQQQALDLLLLKSGLGQWIDRLESLLRDGLFGVDLPLIGDAMDKAADFVASLRDASNLTSTLEGALNGELGSTNPLAGLADAAAVQTEVDSLASAIDGALSDDVQQGAVTGAVLCKHGGTVEACVAGDGIDKIEDVTFTVPLGQIAHESSQDFDIGIPGLGISSEEGIAVTGTWAVTLKLGVSRTDGFFIDTGAADELSVSAGIDLPDTGMAATLGFLKVDIYDGGPQTNCSANPNIDPVTKSCDVDGGSHLPSSSFGPSFTIDLQDGGDGDDRLTMADLTSAPSFGDLFTYDMGVTADINLHLVTSIVGTGGEFPRLFADLALDWGFDATNSDDPKDLRDPADLDVSLTNVAIDAGSFLRDFLGPIVNNIQTFTKPLQPVIDQLNEPIPILSDFAGQPVTLLDLIITFGASQDIDLGLIEDLVKFIDFINGLQAPSGTNLFVVPITGSGAFDLGSSTLLSGPLDQSQARSVFDPADLAAADSNSLLDDLSNATPDASTSEIKKASGLHDIGLFFPFIEKPSQLMGLLFGQDVDLVIWQPRELTASFSYSQKFGPIWTLPPVFLEVGGSAGVTGRFGIGYDTQGLREVLFEGADAGNLLHGLFLLDRRLNDDGSFQTEDPAEIELFGELFANAQVSVLIFSAGAQGSVYTKLGLNLIDPNSDGKLKWTEAADTLRATGNPICLFTFEGRFGVMISVFAEVDLFFWSQRWTKTLADIILYEFEVNCEDPKEPVLAGGDDMDLDALTRPDGSTGGDVFGPGDEHVLKVHLGALRAARGADSVGINEKEETFVLNKEKDQSITVTAFGVSQNYPGPWDAVYVDGGTDGNDGGDVITLNDNVVKGEDQLDGHGGSGSANRCGAGDAVDDDGDTKVNDGCAQQGDTKESGTSCANATDDDGDGYINDGCPTVETSVPFDVNAWITGSGGKDQITAGHGINVVFGSGGNDRITTKEGRDWVKGEEGDDQIGLGNDPNVAGQEDFGDGGAGVDVLDGGPGRDILRGGGNNDTITGGLTIPAQPGDPAKLKSPIAEQPDGVDRIEGGGGDDDLDGGPAGDVIIGGGGADRLNGGPGADTLWGDLENDPASIANDPCTSFPAGNAPYDDVLVGGEDADTVHAGAGDDIVVGGNLITGRPDVGDTQLAGDPGCDLVIGDNAQFTNNSDPRAFELLDPGTGGGDVIQGGSGADHLHGSIGGDTISGDDDEDLLVGGAGADYLDGGNDRDIGYGDGGGITPAAFATAGNDVVVGGNGNDDLYGEGGTDTMLGDVGSVAGGGAVTLTSGNGTDLMYGGGDADRMYGQGGVDTMFGDGGTDLMLGNDGNDIMRGGTAEDEMYGNDGADSMWGDAGPDRMMGGSDGASAPDDGTDTMYGGSGTDVMLGDNGTVTAGPAFVEDLQSDGTPAQLATLEGDADIMYGEAEVDRMYGELGNDRMRGGSGDDYLEGNANGPAPVSPAVLDCDGPEPQPLGDLLLGEADQDDLIGGGDDAGFADGADCIFGEGSVDVMAGDNASITRPGGTDAYDGAVKRSVDLRDLFTDPNGIAGADVMSGGDGPDRMFGGGVGETLMHGDAGDDYLEGNGGGDTAYGDAGQDDLIGGTSQNDAAGSVFTGRHVAPGGNPPTGPIGGTVPDGADTLYGDDGTGGGAADHDLLAGDNASLIRPVDGASHWFLDDLDISRGVTGVARRVLQLFDVATAAAPGADGSGRSGGDFLYGEAGRDIAYGQGGGDTIRGGPGDDYLEGGNGSDDIRGNDGQDDVLGGTGRTRTDDPSTAVDGRLDVGDTLYGGNGDPSVGNDSSDDDDFDVVMGDNATVFRSATGALGDPWTHYDHAGTGVLVVQRYLRLYDVATTTYAPPGGSSGPDQLYGENDDDLMYGQGADDLMKGGGGDDYMEGNASADRMEGQDDQDDMIGGTGIINDDPPTGTDGRLDGGDTMLGGRHADFQLGDNGSIVRPLDEDDHWTYLTEYNTTTVRRDGGPGTTTPARFDVDGPAGTSGGDTMDGNEGDDYQWGQDGNDLMHGNEDNDDMYGELGDDQMFGDAGQDAMVGDRGLIVDTRLDDDSKRVAYDTQGPAFFVYEGLVEGQLDRRVTLTDDGDGGLKPAMGINTGGNDRMRGGPGHDSMHGAYGDDLMNGDSGGDWLFGADGADVMWGGMGADPNSPEDTPTQVEIDAEPGVLEHNLRGVGDRFVDYLFGGHGGQPASGSIAQQVLKADILDYLPRAADPSNGFEGDPDAWFEMTSTDDGDAANDQYHQGIDWMYGGQDRDVMEGDVGKNGPDYGDRLIDWVGAFNLYTRCNESYGDDGDIRQISPAMQTLLQKVAYGSGAGLAPDEVLTSGTSAFRELALVYPGDKGNNGKAFPTTPGHFQNITCEPGT